MWVIRNEQMRVLATSNRDRYLSRLMDTFRALWPEQVSELGDGYLDFLESSISRAAAYGIDSESDVARFINLCFVWGSEFEALPENEWARRILNTPELEGKAKVGELVTRTKFRLKVRSSNRRVAS